VQVARPLEGCLPGCAGSIVHKIAADKQVAGEIVWEGTHRGELNGIPPTGRAVRIEAALFLEAKGGRIVRARHYIDVAGMMAQLG